MPDQTEMQEETDMQQCICGPDQTGEQPDTRPDCPACNPPEPDVDQPSALGAAFTRMNAQLSEGVRQLAAHINAAAATQRVLSEVRTERRKQDEKWGTQDHPDGTGQWQETIDADVARMACQDAAEGGYLDWLHILREEYAEAMAETDPARLRAELLQVAAVAVCWVEAIDRRVAQEATGA